MSRTRLLRAALIVSVAATLVGVPAGAALASVHGTLTVTTTPPSSPPSCAPSSTCTFNVDFHTDNASSGGDAPECLVFTLTGFTLSGTPTFTAPDSHSWGTPVVAGNTVTVKANSDADAMGNNEDAVLHVSAAAPSTPGTKTWTLDSWSNRDGCDHPNTSHFTATATVNVGSPGPTISVTCTPNPVAVNAASTCTATLSGGTISGQTINWTHTGTGNFSVLSCVTNASGACSVTYTPTSAVGSPHRITATKTGGTPTGFVDLVVTSSTAPPPGKNNTQTTLTCPGTPTVGVALPCTATVKDIGGNVAISHPLGTVSFSTSGGGAWASPATCTLVALASPNTDSSSCPLNYTPSATGAQTLTATYTPGNGDTTHVGSVGTAGITVQPGQAAPGNFQPDEWIKLLHAKTFKGNNIYNGTGGRQTVFARARHRHSRTAVITIQNDGDTTDRLIVTGQGHRPGFSIKYFHGKQNISNAVVSRVYVLNLAPGATSKIRVVVTVLKGARVGLVRSWQIEARSTGDPTKRDVVKFKVGVLKH